MNLDKEAGDDSALRRQVQGGIQGHRRAVFTGFDAYKKVLASDVDLVILATPPGFRPMHLAAAVAAGKHVFTEKPVAVDSAGIRSVLATDEAAQKKKLGDRRRHAAPPPGRIPRDDRAASTTARSATSSAGRCSGTRADSGTSGRQAELDRHRVADPQLALLHLALRRPHRRAARPQHRRRELGAARTPGAARSASAGGSSAADPKYGHIFDHFAVDFEYPNGARVMSMCRQIEGTANQRSARASSARRAAPTRRPGSSARTRGPTRSRPGRSTRTCRSTPT